ncbi:MAG: isoamylase early set domain-containing protein [Chloroflexota bacterium]|nr:isoamylase early set domain-containing protein [Chloroflexota bacterium]
MKKSYTKTKTSCRVTFELPAEIGAETASVVGEFNAWDKESHPLKKRKDGHFSRTVYLDADKEYRFRYWVDGERWENDWEADKYLPNEFGSEDSVVLT